MNPLMAAAAAAVFLQKKRKEIANSFKNCYENVTECILGLVCKCLIQLS